MAGKKQDKDEVVMACYLPSKTRKLVNVIGAFNDLSQAQVVSMAVDFWVRHHPEYDAGKVTGITKHAQAKAKEHDDETVRESTVEEAAE